MDEIKEAGSDDESDYGDNDLLLNNQQQQRSNSIATTSLLNQKQKLQQFHQSNLQPTPENQLNDQINQLDLTQEQDSTQHPTMQ